MCRDGSPNRCALLSALIIGVLLGIRLRFGVFDRPGRPSATAMGETRVHKSAETRLLPGFTPSGQIVDIALNDAQDTLLTCLGA